ncbi:uncharacterized protein N7498_005363 [Penicillium cinerascens]|uniref:Uncharacterized protein n=1 Tax=Penicillium cinerascens TaxID=70096 RepID=A0A9W9T040_9EURO|nr:uncharacterized protein N7498_005363 [Penicillium cinerascens]KAJ5204484.1 hypothetical protein N7498_005363 [Penicillium cinerascens]
MNLKTEKELYSSFPQQPIDESSRSALGRNFDLHMCYGLSLVRRSIICYPVEESWGVIHHGVEFDD